MPGSLALLVGSNPLPNYLAAMALNPATVQLVCSPETQAPSRRLRAALEAADLGATMPDDVVVSDACSGAEIADKIATLMHEGDLQVHLHYTGGTKVMAAHALKAFYEHGGANSNASPLG